MHTNRVLFQIVIAAATLVGATSCDIDIVEPTENQIQQKNVPGSIPFSITGGSEGSETRAILDTDGLYYWQPNDQVGLSIVETGTTNPVIASNIFLTSDQEEPKSIHTTFSGKLEPVQINNLTSDKTYDYYSYFPYSIGNIGTLPNLSFTIPSSLTLTPGVFNPNYAPMAAVNTGKRPIVYLDGEDLVCPDDLVHFDYKHILSYAAIEMDVRLLGGNVTSITLTNNSGRHICGNYSYDMSTGECFIASGGSSIFTINITEGLTVGDGKVLYVPMPPVDMRGNTFTVSFATSTTNKYENVANVNGADFKRGQIHRLRVAPVVKYTTNETFTITKAGYYFIEAWGGDGGNGGDGSGTLAEAEGDSGGKGIRTSGLYYFNAGEQLNVQVGTAGKNGGNNNGSQRGTAGAAGSGAHFGNGSIGGNGGNGYGFYVGGGAGGGGGAASGVLKGGTNPTNIVIASGGGGGGGGGGWNKKGGKGGDSNQKGLNGGAKGGDLWSSTVMYGINYIGGARHNGQDGDFWNGNRGGGGAGGGGGGWDSANGGGGYSGVGGARANANDGGGGGGGAGGKSSSGTTAPNQGFTLPTNMKPENRTDGYVVITFFRPL